MTSLGLTLGNWIGLGFIVLLAAGLPASLTLARRHEAKQKYDWESDAKIIRGFGWASFSLAVLIALLALFPLQPRYWQAYSITGEVLAVSNVITESSGDLTRQPVVTLDGFDRPLLVDDPRITTLEGQTVTLRCIPSWHYQAADTWGCSIRDYEGDPR